MAPRPLAPLSLARATHLPWLRAQGREACLGPRGFSGASSCLSRVENVSGQQDRPSPDGDARGRLVPPQGHLLLESSAEGEHVQGQTTLSPAVLAVAGALTLRIAQVRGVILSSWGDGGLWSPFTQNLPLSGTSIHLPSLRLEVPTLLKDTHHGQCLFSRPCCSAPSPPFHAAEMWPECCKPQLLLPGHILPGLC